MLVTRMAESPFYLSIATYYEGKLLWPELPMLRIRKIGTIKMSHHAI